MYFSIVIGNKDWKIAIYSWVWRISDTNRWDHSLEAFLQLKFSALIWIQWSWSARRYSIGYVSICEQKLLHCLRSKHSIFAMGNLRIVTVTQREIGLLYWNIQKHVEKHWKGEWDCWKSNTQFTRKMNLQL